MKILIVLILLFSATAEGSEYCVDKWLDNYSMIDYCKTKQQKAAATLTPMFNANETYKKIIFKCSEKFTKGDYSMILYCSKRQIKSYKKLLKAGVIK
jgi:hypothetical protein